MDRARPSQQPDPRFEDPSPPRHARRESGDDIVSEVSHTFATRLADVLKPEWSSEPQDR